MLARDTERARLNRRIRILPKDVARELKYYRQRISSKTAIEERDVAMTFVPKGTSGFFEGADVVELCHKFLDDRGIEINPPEPNHRGKPTQ